MSMSDGGNQIVYVTDSNRNFFKLEVISGDIFSRVTFLVYKKFGNTWIPLGERVSNSGIKKGAKMWGLVTVDSFYVNNQV